MNWRDVLADWCSPTEVPAPAGAPPPLTAFLGAGGAAALSHQNRFQEPEVEGGWSVFYVENQYVCTWAYRTGDPDDDPEVHVREEEAGGAYEPVSARLDAFLSAAAVVEATFGAGATLAAEGPSASVPAVLGLPALGLPDLGWPPGLRRPTTATATCSRSRSPTANARPCSRARARRPRSQTSKTASAKPPDGALCRRPPSPRRRWSPPDGRG